LFKTKLINILRLYLCLDVKRVRFRHDEHDHLALTDDTTNGVDVKLVDHAVLRCANIHALELILCGYFLLDEFGDLAADIGQILTDFSAHVLIDLQDLQLDFGHFALGLGDRCGQLTAFPIEPLLFAFESRHPGIGNLLFQSSFTPTSSFLIQSI
jgi:hypothetical protein